jgi:hypothetical protein
MKETNAMTQQKTPQQNLKDALIEVFFPPLTKILAGIVWLTEQPIRIQNERNRRKILDRQLENLTDPTFLDRATAGDKGNV